MDIARNVGLNIVQRLLAPQSRQSASDLAQSERTSSALDRFFLDKAQASERMEVPSDLACPLPVAVITALLGADPEMAEPLGVGLTLRWLESIISSHDR